MQTSAFHLEETAIALTTFVSLMAPSQPPEFYFLRFDKVTGDLTIHGVAGALHSPCYPFGDAVLDFTDTLAVLAASTNAVLLAISASDSEED